MRRRFPNPNNVFANLTAARTRIVSIFLGVQIPSYFLGLCSVENFRMKKALKSLYMSVAHHRKHQSSPTASGDGQKGPSVDLHPQGVHCSDTIASPPATVLQSVTDCVARTESGKPGFTGRGLNGDEGTKASLTTDDEGCLSITRLADPKQNIRRLQVRPLSQN